MQNLSANRITKQGMRAQLLTRILRQTAIIGRLTVIDGQSSADYGQTVAGWGFWLDRKQARESKAINKDVLCVADVSLCESLKSC